MTNYVTVNDGLDYGTNAGRLAPVMQGEVGPPYLIDVQDLAGNDFDITNATDLEGRLENAKTEITIDITGALATSGGGISWTRAAEDIGTAGTFSAVFEFTLSGKQYKTFPASIAVIADPAATALGGVALVGIPETDADWLTAEKAATEAAADGEILQSDGTNSEGSGYLTATSLRQHNFTATAAPGVGDDTADGYAPGSRWIDVTNDKEYVCLDASAGAAVWTETTAGGGASDISSLTATGYTDGSYIDVLDEAFRERTAAQVLSGIGAAAAVHTHSYQPLDAGLTDLAGLDVTDGNIIVGDGANWVAESGATARTSLGLAAGGAGDIWVEKAGDTMTGALVLPANGLTVGSTQLSVVNGSVGIGALANTAYKLYVVHSGSQKVRIDGPSSGSAIVALVSPEVAEWNIQLTGANRFVIRNETGGRDIMTMLTDSTVHIGNGVTNASPASGSLGATGGSGTNVAGASLPIAAGKGTGNAATGRVVLQNSIPGASGSALQTLKDRWSLEAAGDLAAWQESTTTTRQVLGIVPTLPTATDASRKGRAVFNVFDTVAREGLRIEASGTAPMIGFLGADAVARQAHIADAAGTDAAIINAILDVLEAFGLVATS